MKIGIVAGEASGDLLGAKLIQALREKNPAISFEGVAGPAMQAAGCHNLFDIERLSVMGLIEPLKRLPDLIKLRRDLYQHFTTHRPDLFIGIDAPDFNLGLELKLRQTGIPVVHYVSPSVWAWRQGRIHKIKKAVNLMLTLFPFEAAFYEKHHVPVHYVGHPLAEQIPLVPDTKSARHALGLELESPYVALLPGSRKQEIRYLAETMLLAAKRIAKERPNTKFITSHINEDRAKAFADYMKQHAPDLPLRFFIQRTHEVMAAADVVIVTSGTATLETMLYKKPMVIVYKMSGITYQLAKWLVKLPHIGLPNLLANERLVPELIQHQASPEAISHHVLDYLANPHKISKLCERFTELHKKLSVESAQIHKIIMGLVETYE